MTSSDHLDEVAGAKARKTPQLDSKKKILEKVELEIDSGQDIGCALAVFFSMQMKASDLRDHAFSCLSYRPRSGGLYRRTLFGINIQPLFHHNVRACCTKLTSLCQELRRADNLFLETIVRLQVGHAGKEAFTCELWIIEPTES